MGYNIDHIIGEMATRQHGVVATRHLVAAGVSRRAISDRTTRGMLHPAHRGVHFVGHAAPSQRGRWMAAVLAAGDDAVLGEMAAACLFGFVNQTRARPTVLVPRRHRGLPRIEVIGTPRLVALDWLLLDGIRSTTIERTLFDLARIRKVDQLVHHMHRAEFGYFLDLTRLSDLVSRHRELAQTAVFQTALDRYYNGEGGVFSELERKVVDLLVAAGFPRPRLNVVLFLAGGCHRADLIWDDRRLVLEVDGGPHARPTDQRNDVKVTGLLEANGYEVIRCTEDEVHHTAHVIVARVAAAFQRTDRRRAR